MNERLAGKVAFITGTAGGQGRAAAQLFARHGARIVGCDLKAEESQETVELVTAEGGSMVSLHPLDLSTEGAPRQWIEFGLEAFGSIDVLYNNAGAPRFAAIDGEDGGDAWAFTIRNELDIMFWTIRAAWPELPADGGGSIINTSSGAAGRGFPVAIGGPGSSVGHSAAKAGVLGLTVQVAAEGAPLGIRANALIPGLIESPPAEALLADAELRRKCADANLIKRIGQPEDIAWAAIYLASEESSFVTGTSICVDGGLTAKGPWYDIAAEQSELSDRPELSASPAS